MQYPEEISLESVSLKHKQAKTIPQEGMETQIPSLLLFKTPG